MKTFLENVAESLWQQYGEGISDLNVLLPNKRSRLFLNEAISKISGKPLWQPNYISIDELMGEIAGIVSIDKVRAVVELYKVYSRYHKESFDSFYFWGEMLLNDFDQIDKYRINAKLLFANIQDIKDIDYVTDYLSGEQAGVVARFWRAFKVESEQSEEKRKFLNVWETLHPVYEEFREELKTLGAAYTGMVHRIASDKILSENITCTEGKRYTVVGFNALSQCEKVLFDHLKKACGADFFWDYDDYYLKDKRQEAGLFMRENLIRYAQAAFYVSNTDNFKEPKEITVISAISDSMQCKYASEFFDKVAAKNGGKIGKETAVVLTDESLLVPFLYSLPESIENLNITMGYPLRQSLAYSFVERLLKLQLHVKQKGDRQAFYHSDATGVLNHPYLIACDAVNSARILNDIIKQSLIYIEEGAFVTGTIIERVFKVCSTWSELADYIIDILSDIARGAVVAMEDVKERMLQREFFGVIADNIRKLTNSLVDCGVEIDLRIFTSLLKRMLQNLRIPYSGEPLNGVQIMGILETRNLDFENVLILSMNDDKFPGSPSASASFIPYNLRLAYGLPTPQHHDGVYAYYFYRLLQRTGKVDLVYCSKSDEKNSGEQSRYIYQLEYESDHNLNKWDIEVDMDFQQAQAINIAKDKAVMQKLERYLDGGGKKLSPTGFNAYLDCPLKFYLRYVAGLKTQDALLEEVDVLMFGNILHKAMEVLYKDIVGVTEPWKEIKALIGSSKVKEAVERAINEEFLKTDGNSEEYKGNTVMVRDVVMRYINNGILPYDARQSGYRILAVEKGIGADFAFGTGGGVRNVRFEGLADRIDMLDNGVVRVVDYKTGMPHIDFAGVSALFSSEPKDRRPAVLQTFIYSLAVRKMQEQGEITGGDVCPALYYVRNMNTPDYSPMLDNKAVGDVEGYNEYREEVEGFLAEKLTEIFSSEIPFTQCESTKPCEYCDFDSICQRR